MRRTNRAKTPSTARAASAARRKRLELAHRPAVLCRSTLIAYALFGPSRILVLGPASALVALIAVAVTASMHRSGAQAVMLASALALLSGGLCAAVGLFKLGFVADLLSTPIRYGYLNGIMLPIIIGQLPKLLGSDARPIPGLVLLRWDAPLLRTDGSQCGQRLPAAA
jgi:hypothetical protein